MCDKCDSGNYIWETSHKLRFRLNNHKQSIRDNSRGFPVAVHFNQSDHSLINLWCVILRGDFTMTADRLICEQAFMHKLLTLSNGLDKDLSFLSPNSFFHLWWQLLTYTSGNNTEVWHKNLSNVFFCSHFPPVHHRGRTEKCSKTLVVLLRFI